MKKSIIAAVLALAATQATAGTLPADLQESINVACHTHGEISATVYEGRNVFSSREMDAFKSYAIGAFTSNQGIPDWIKDEYAQSIETAFLNGMLAASGYDAERATRDICITNMTERTKAALGL